MGWWGGTTGHCDPVLQHRCGQRQWRCGLVRWAGAAATVMVTVTRLFLGHPDLRPGHECGGTGTDHGPDAGHPEPIWTQAGISLVKIENGTSEVWQMPKEAAIRSWRSSAGIPRPDCRVWARRRTPT